MIFETTLIGLLSIMVITGLIYLIIIISGVLTLMMYQFKLMMSLIKKK